MQDPEAAVHTAAPLPMLHTAHAGSAHSSESHSRTSPSSHDGPSLGKSITSTADVMAL